MPRPRRSDSKQNGKRSAKGSAGPLLDHIVFDGAAEDADPDNFKAYEKLLTQEVIDNGEHGAQPRIGRRRAMSAAERRAQIWIESEAVLAELKRQALEDGDSSDLEETRKLPISQYQLAAALERNQQERTVIAQLDDWLHAAGIWLSQMWRAAVPYVRMLSIFIARWFLILVSLVKTHGGKLVRQTLQFLSATGSRLAHRHPELLRDELQGVRTSFPPPPAVSRRRRILGIGKIAVVVAVFLVAVIMIFSTPAPRQAFQGLAVNSYLSKGASVSLAQYSSVPLLALSENKVPVAEVMAATPADAQPRANTRNDVQKSDDVTASQLASVDRRKPAEENTRVAPARGQRTVDTNTPDTTAGGETASSSRLPLGRKAATAPSVDAVSASSATEPVAMSAAGTLPQYGSAPVQPSLPFVPPRTAVKTAMQRVAQRVGQCRTAQSGQMVMKIVISGASGQVVSSKVLDDVFSGTPTGICAMQAIRTAQFPKFQKETLVIRYPFQL